MSENIKENEEIKDLELIKRNKELVDKFPWILPRNRWTGVVPEFYDYTYTELDAIPEGWMKAFGLQMAEDINEELIKSKTSHTFRVTQIKEKYGRFEFYHCGGSSEVSEIIEDYGNISENICIRCGKLDVPIICNNGWYEPICKDCYESQEDEKERKGFGRSRFSYEDHLKEIKEEGEDEDFTIPLTREFSRFYNKDGVLVREEHSRDLTETVTRIRARYKAENENLK